MVHSVPSSNLLQLLNSVELTLSPTATYYTAAHYGLNFQILTKNYEDLLDSYFMDQYDNKTQF